MERLEKMMTPEVEPNRKANAKIRYANGLRNSFGKCWYLTQYGYNITYEDGTWEHYDSSDRKGFKNNPFAQKAYSTVDRLMSEAFADFTDPEQAAKAQLDMMNFKTVASLYPDSKAAALVRGHCDNLYDYALQRR